jgi:molybdenum cofactor cytidylyltransferase
MQLNGKIHLEPDNISGLILSAGLSGRMKRFKPLADYKGKTFIEHIIFKLDKVCKQIVIVTGYNSDTLQTFLKGRFNSSESLSKKMIFAYNNAFLDEMFTSLQRGVSEVESDWVIYHFVDQPGLPIEFYNDFVKQVENNVNWIQPVNNNRKGHPILLNKKLFQIIIDSPPDSTLRDISRNPVIKKKYWECSYPEIFQDIDTEENYNMLFK